MRCPLCHMEIPDDALFCKHCGNKIPRCPTCGTTVGKGMKFCVVDGTRIPEEILTLYESTTPAPSAPVVPAKKKASKGFLIAQIILISVIVIVLGILAVLWISGSSDKPADTPNKISEQKEAAAPEAAPQKAPEQIEPTTQPAPPPTTVPPTTTPPTTAPVITYEYRYEIIQSDMSWTEAKAACEAKGGYLATITSVEEYNEICRLADETDLIYLWLGARLPNQTMTWKQAGWITGESWTFDNWYPGEPSKQDTDGTYESYLCMWTVKDGPWTFNDQRNDIVAKLPSISGLVGYVCEYKIEVIN